MEAKAPLRGVSPLTGLLCAGIACVYIAFRGVMWMGRTWGWGKGDGKNPCWLSENIKLLTDKEQEQLCSEDAGWCMGRVRLDRDPWPSPALDGWSSCHCDRLEGREKSSGWSSLVVCLQPPFSLRMPVDVYTFPLAASQTGFSRLKCVGHALFW